MIFGGRCPSTVAMPLIVAAVGLLLGACQAEPTLPTARSDSTHTSAAQGSDSSTVGRDSTPTASLGPNSVTEQMAITPTPSDVAFTLTILHTGEVYGEVEPCG